MVAVRFSLTGSRKYYGTTNHVTWFPIAPHEATQMVENGVPLELV